MIYGLAGSSSPPAPRARALICSADVPDKLAQSVGSHSSLQAREGCKPPGREQGWGIYFSPSKAQGTFVCVPKHRARIGAFLCYKEELRSLALWERGGKSCTSILVPLTDSQRSVQRGKRVPFARPQMLSLSQVKPGATAEIDGCRGSGAGARSGVSQGCSPRGPHPALTLGQGAAALHGSGPCGGSVGAALGTLTAPGLRRQDSKGEVMPVSAHPSPPLAGCSRGKRRLWQL